MQEGRAKVCTLTSGGRSSERDGESMGGGSRAAHPPLEQLEHPRLSLPTMPAVLKQKRKVSTPG